MEFHGKPMFHWNLLKAKELFDKVYVSTDSTEILEEAVSLGAHGILRPKNLCGDTPDIPVYQHAIEYMHGVNAVVAIHANNPTLKPEIISKVKQLVDSGVEEVMTCYPLAGNGNYHEQAGKVNGSVRGFSFDRIRAYGDPYRPKPEILVVDDSVEIETEESYEEASCQFRRQL